MDAKTLATLKEGYLKAGLPPDKVEGMINYLGRFDTFTQAREHLLKQRAYWKRKDAERDAKRDIREGERGEALRLSALRDDPPMLKWKGTDYPDWSEVGDNRLANEWAKIRGYNAFWTKGVKGEKQILRIWKEPDDDKYYQNLPWQKGKLKQQERIVEEISNGSTK